MLTKITFLFLFCAGFLSSCTTRIGDFTVISSKNVDVENGGKYVKTGTFEGEDKAHIIIFIPTGTPDLKNAVDRCIEAGDGHLLTNAVISSSWLWLVVYGQTGYVVKGDVWKRANSGDLMDPTKEIFELKKNEFGMVLTSTLDASKSYTVADPSNPSSIKVD